MNLLVVAIKRCDIGWPLVLDEEPDDRASLVGIKRITTSVLTDRLTTLLLANWGATYGPEVATNPLWVAKAKADPVGRRQLIRETIR